MKKYTFGIFAAALMVAFLATTGLMTKAVEAAIAACTTEVITDGDVVRAPEGTPPAQNWMLYTRNAGQGTFREGPGTPSKGTGSLEFVTPTANDKVWLFNYDHVGKSLADVSSMGYSTYRTAGSAQQVASINLEIDFNGPAEGGYAVLVFEPVYNTAQGTVTDGVWQTWDAYNGGNAIWWSSRAIPGVCAFDCFVTWNSIVAANPDDVVVGGFGVNQGSGNAGLTSAVDYLEIGFGSECFTYDFELTEVVEPAVPTTKEQCMNNGWRTLVDRDGNSFRNQGQCVAFVASGGKSGGKK